MTWVRLEPDVYDHPKIGAVPKAARWVWVAGLAYANRHLTDGLLPPSALRAVDASRADVRALVAAGLWEPVHDVQTGWRIHDFAEYQPTREQVESERAAARRRMARLRRNGA